MASEIYEVRVQGCFSATHQLRLANGAYEPMHGHDWKVEAIFRGAQLNNLDMLIDFEEAMAALRDVLAQLNYTNLNTLPQLADRNPTAEWVAAHLYNELRNRLGSAAPLAEVRVEEAPGCIACYRPMM